MIRLNDKFLPKIDVIFDFQNVHTDTIYTLKDGKKFSDYKFIEFSSAGQTIIKTFNSYESPFSNWLQLIWYENIAIGKTELLVEIAWISDTQFRCHKAGYSGNSDIIFYDNPYPIIIRGIT